MAAGDIEWDDQKEAANYARRGIAFGEAATVFLDEDLIVRVDREHGREDRLVSVGLSRRGRLLTVVTAEPAALVCRLASGERHVIVAGSILAELADWAAGTATPRRRGALDAASA